MKFRCVIHGSFRKHFDLIAEAHDCFSRAGIEVLAPDVCEVVDVKDGFALFAGEEGLDPRLIELKYLHQVKRLGRYGFSYFVNPQGTLGSSASYELGIAQLTNTRCFFSSPLLDHPAYVRDNSIWLPEGLSEFISEFRSLPEPQIGPNTQEIDRLWTSLMVPGSVVAAGAIIEHVSDAKTESEILLVRTHKWGGRFSIVGGKVRRNERLADALLREVKEETGLLGRVGKHLCTFDQLEESGYYKSGISHIFVDNVVHVASKNVVLNEEAQEFVWMPAANALRELEIEPNARLTVELYHQAFIPSSSLAGSLA